MNTFSGNQRFEAPNVLWTIHAVGNNDCELAGNPGKENIRFRGGMVPGFSSSNTHVDFQVVNSMFHNGSDLVKGDPVIRIPLDTGEHAEVQILVSISGTPFLCRSAGFFAVADIFPLYHVHFGTDPFDAASMSFFVGNTTILHGKGRVIWTGGIAVFVVIDFFEGAFISWIVRDERHGEMKIIPQHSIGFDGIEGGISQECIGVKRGMKGKEIGKHGF